MNISKWGRLLYGMIALVSMALFMGTPPGGPESTGCFDCNTSNNGSIIMVNNSWTAYNFIISGTTSTEKVVDGQSSSTVWVEAGEYTVYSWGNPPYFKIKGKTWNFTLAMSGSKTVVQD